MSRIDERGGELAGDARSSCGSSSGEHSAVWDSAVGVSQPQQASLSEARSEGEPEGEIERDERLQRAARDLYGLGKSNTASNVK